MGFEPIGKHLIAGEWVDGPARFKAEQISGRGFEYAVGTAELVARAAEAAEAAFASYAALPRATRAGFLNKIADEIESRGAEITEIGCDETGLPEARLNGERARTVGQLRLFAAHIEKGEYLDRRHDGALPDRKPLARPDLRLVQQPIGPVAVFGASNFPLAFSTAGGDTAAALAAGCPVVVKGHSAHPGTGEIVARAVDAAIKACGLHPGVFSLIQAGDRKVGEALVTHPRIKAVGFTGSLGGGRALFNLCAARPEPIPFFGELGSLNPMFVLPEALAARGGEIGRAWAPSLTGSCGQLCTNGSVVLLVDGPGADAFVAGIRDGLAGIASQPMLTRGIAAAFHKGAAALKAVPGVGVLVDAPVEERAAGPVLLQTSSEVFRANHILQEEVFGPLGVIVRLQDTDELETLAASLQGQLTATVHMDDADAPLAKRLLPHLERMAGRVLFNGFPTGVEVVDSMVHGGPYPASTNFGATSVGTLSIRRFLRPVCYQNLPAALAAGDLA
ncbi:aldehyde dehydrogenase (NADP(+)) [Xanthobacter sediminis]